LGGSEKIIPKAPRNKLPCNSPKNREPRGLKNRLPPKTPRAIVDLNLGSLGVSNLRFLGWFRKNNTQGTKEHII